MERLSDTAIAILNELHTERLDYHSEYIPLIDAANKLAAYEDTGLEPERVAELAKAERDGRLVELPFPQGGILLDRSYKQNPELLENFRLAIAYDHSGIVFHQPISIFLENVKRGYISEVSEEAEAAIEARKGESHEADPV